MTLSPETQAWIGWDLGGAHVKLAWVDADGGLQRVTQLPCALWQGMDQFHAAVAPVLEGLKAGARHALTMTGELVDLFPDRAAGVRALCEAMAHHVPPARSRYYAGARGFVDRTGVEQAPEAVASANWHASAAFAASRLSQGLVLDIGSTTTDVVAFRDGTVGSGAQDDAQRLAAEELVYTGVVRTPVMSLAQAVPVNGQWTGLMAEAFATAADVHRLNGALPAGADQHPSADGAGKDARDSARRLARMTGRDLEALSLDQWQDVAGYLAAAQCWRIERACHRVLGGAGLDAAAPVVGAGVGRFLAQRVAARLDRPYVDFGDLCAAVDEDVAARAGDCAPAVAVARLARNETWA